MSWIRNAVAVAAAIVAFFLMATPIANSDMGTSTMSNLQTSMLQKLMPKDSNMTPAQPIATALSKDSIKEETAKEDVVKEETKTAEPEPIPTTRYCIVLASQVKLSNAEQYVEQLKSRGMQDAEVYIHNHIVRVIYGSYESESEAYRHLNKLNKHDEFAEAWVYKKSA
jgi:cell division septation protein DedD